MNALMVYRAGTAALFPAYFWSALAVLGSAAILFHLADRMSRRRLFLVTHICITVAIVVVWWILQYIALPLAMYPLVRAALYGSYVVMSLQRWLCASDTFTSYEAKHGYPTIVAATILGLMVGGFITEHCAPHMPVVHFLLAWAGIVVVSPLLLRAVRAPHDVPMFHQPLATHTQVTTSRALIILLFLFWLCYAFVSHGIDYLFNTTAVAVLPTADALTAFYGRVTWWASLAVLGYMLLLAKPLTARFGVDRAIAIIPGFAVIACGLLYARSSLYAVAWSEGLLNFVADFASAALLYPLLSVFPRARRGRIQMFTEGAGRSAGALALLLLALGLWWSHVDDPTRLRNVLFATALGFCAYPFILHRIYIRHLVTCLRSNDLELVTNAIQALGERNKRSAVRPLLRLLRATNAIHLKKTIVLSLGQMRSGEAFPEVVQLFSVRNEALQSAVVEALSDYRNYESLLAIFRLMKSGQNVSLQVRMNAIMLLTRLVGRAMIPFLLEMLDDPDPRVQANTIEALGMLRDRKLIALLTPFLRHAHHRVRASAIIALHPFRFGRKATRRAAEEALELLWHSATPNDRRTALYVIGVLRCTSYLPALLPLLRDSDRVLRQLAATAVAKMEDPAFVAPFVELLLASDDAFAIDTAKRMGQFPPSSRAWVFQQINTLPESSIELLTYRFDATGLDFSAERDLVTRQATAISYLPW